MSNLEHWGHVDNKGRYASELAEEKEHPWYAHAPDNEALDTLICWFDVAIFNLNRKIIKFPIIQLFTLRMVWTGPPLTFPSLLQRFSAPPWNWKFWSLEKIRVVTSFWESLRARAGCQSWARETTAERRLPLPIGLILYEEGYGRLMMDNFIWEKSW